MTARVENPLAKREQFAMDQRKTKRKDIVQSKRELYSCKTPLERSVSPMFGGGCEASRKNEQIDEEAHAPFEEEKQVNDNVVHSAGSTEGAQHVMRTYDVAQMDCAFGDARGTGRTHLDALKECAEGMRNKMNCA